MITTQLRKNRIYLEEYDYQWDIRQRLFLANLTRLESEILTEIVNGSLTTTITKLSKILNLEEQKLSSIITKFCEIELIQIQDQIIFVNKEIRKYYETHIVKFEKDFKPNVEFLQSLLNKLPIHILPNWYAIPKTSDHIFLSIVEKYLQTPKTYGDYLKELTFDHPILNAIFHDLYKSENFEISVRAIRDKYNLTDEQMTEYILELEYHLVCCVRYKSVGNYFEEYLTPFHEWHEYLTFRHNTTPKSIECPNEIQKYHPDDFGFTKDLNTILNALNSSNLSIELTYKECTFNQDTAKNLFPHYSKLSNAQEHIKNLLAKILELKLGKIENNQLVRTYQSEDWLVKPLKEQAMLLYRHPGSCFRDLKQQSISYTDRDMRETEKNLKRILHKNWIYFDEFLKGFTAQVGNTEMMMLVKRGRNWSYERPKYSEQDILLIQRIILGRLFEAGMIAIGTYHNQLCIRLTDFGKETFAE